MAEPENLPVLHSGVPDNDPLEADSTREAIIVQQWDEEAIVLGDETKDEWIIAPNAYGLDWMR